MIAAAPTSTAIPPEAYDRWNRILVRSGWLDAPVPYDQVERVVEAELGLPIEKLFTE